MKFLNFLIDNLNKRKHGINLNNCVLIKPFKNTVSIGH